MNFAKRCCSDDANLCEIISVTAEDTTMQDFIDDLLKKNRFDVRYRDQLERTSAAGTTGAYIYIQNADYYKMADGSINIKGGKVRINYCEAESIIPLTVDNGTVVECAFASTNMVKGVNKTTLVIFTIEQDGRYLAETVKFDDMGNELVDEYLSIKLGEVKPFAIMQNAEVNNLDNMEGYGLPKIYNTIPFFQAIDLCYALLYGDLDKGQKVVFINELLACIKTAENGQPYLTPKQQELFILLGEKLPSQDSVIKEYNPEIRIDSITKAFELVLSLISMTFGYGTKKYSFENGQITTATEYIGEKQDEVQELNKQRKQATDYINDLIHAAAWFANNFQGTSFDEDVELTIEFDDSYVEDKASRLEMERADALSFPEIPQLKVWYLMDAYNISEEEAEELIQAANTPEDEPTEDEEGDEGFNIDDDEEIQSLLAEIGGDKGE